MLKTTFPIDFIRQIITQTMEEEHYKDFNLYGGDNQVNLFSFYEQLAQGNEVDRYVENFRALTNQENRTSLIMNGIIVAPENPTLTNLNNCDIIPLTFTCVFRVKLGNRDDALKTINNTIEILKGRKIDVAQFENDKIFKVGTMANNSTGNPLIKNGDYIGQCLNANLNTFISNLLTSLSTNFGMSESGLDNYYYVDYNDTITPLREFIVVKKNNGTWEKITSGSGIIFPNGKVLTDKWQVSMSFDSIRCDEPMILNAEEYCTISFGGSATIVNARIRLGNELSKLGIKRYSVQTSTTISINESNYHWLEPLELPSNNNADTQIRQLFNKNFVSETHSDALTISMQYTFILDKDESLINLWFKYARYGIQNIGSSGNIYANAITPNMIYEIVELWSCWGEIEYYKYQAKIVETIDIELTESDVLSITIPLQPQAQGEKV